MHAAEPADGHVQVGEPIKRVIQCSQASYDRGGQAAGVEHGSVERHELLSQERQIWYRSDGLLYGSQRSSDRWHKQWDLRRRACKHLKHRLCCAERRPATFRGAQAIREGE